ncbi:MAG: hypothetical protein ACLPKI_22210 [Streptosporangiaceae bacterium]
MDVLNHLLAGPAAGLNNGESMSGGNTTAERPMRFGAPGSEPIDAPPDRFNQQVPMLPGVSDPVPAVGRDGAKSGRPAQSPASLVTGREWPH